MSENERGKSWGERRKTERGRQRKGQRNRGVEVEGTPATRASPELKPELKPEPKPEPQIIESSA